MRLLLKWLRPDTVPSPGRKNLPFGTKFRLDAYRKCLKILRKWYGRYAFSDTIIIPGRPHTKVIHEFRDQAFETELKRLKMQIPEKIIIRDGQTSTRENSSKAFLFFRDFRFEDTMTLIIGGQRVSVNHGQGDSFSSSQPGVLKETDNNSLVRKYLFTAAGPAQHEQKPGKAKSNISTSISSNPSPQEAGPSGPKPPAKDLGTQNPGRPRKQGPLFKNDPLLGIIKEQPQTTPAPSPPPIPEEEPIPTTKTVAGVIIDESF